MSETKDSHAYYAQPILETVQQLDSTLVSGLSQAEVQLRQQTHGWNELPSAQPTPRWQKFIQQFNDFVVILLIAAAAISLLLGDTLEAIAIFAIVLLNALIGFWQEQQADAALDELKQMSAPVAHVLRAGQRMDIPARELVLGDIVFLEAGNYIPADVQLIESHHLQINESALTGESVPVAKQAEALVNPNAAIGDQINMAFSGTLITNGRGRGIVTAIGLRTELGLIARILSEIESEQTPLQRRLNQLGQTLSIGALILCVLVFIIQSIRNTDLSLITQQGLLAYLQTESAELTDFFILAVSLAVAAVPEGLAAIVTINLALGMREMVKRHALIRRLTAVETLGSTTVICSDKTGTLTQNVMTVVQVYVDGLGFRVTGERYSPVGEFVEIEVEVAKNPRREHNPARVKDATPPILRELLRGALLCSDAILEKVDDDYRIIGDPTEGALVVAAAKAGLWRAEVEKQTPRISEIPFDADRKMMTTVHRQHPNHLVVTKGAPDVVLARCTQIMRAQGERAVIREGDRQAITAAQAAMSAQALRVLAVAVGTVPDTVSLDSLSEADLEANLTFIGLLGMIDPPRPEVATAMRTAHTASMRTIMITGDYPETARTIAEQIGLVEAQGATAPSIAALPGTEIALLDDAALAKQVQVVSVFARVSPEHKVRIVNALKSQGHVVAMTGDGVNDAPALKRADIGVAMGITGTDVSKETADMVLTDDNFASIVSAVEQGRVIYANIRKFVAYLLGCNLAEIAIIFVATLLGLKSPLSAIQLLWLNLLTDGAPALALGLERAEPDVMRQPPRAPNEPVINRRMLMNMSVQALALAATVLIVYGVALQWMPTQAGTMAFLTLALAELPLAYSGRSERYSALRLGLFSNRYLQAAIALSVVGVLVVVYIPFMNTVFGTVALGLNAWLILLPSIFVPALVVEGVKGAARVRHEAQGL